MSTFDSGESQNPNKYERVAKDAVEYVNLRYNYLKLEAVEKLSLLLSSFFFAIIFLILAFCAFLYFSFALIYWTSELWGSVIPGFLISGSLFIILIIVLYAFRKKLLINPLVKKFSQTFFDNIYETADNETE